MATLVVLCLCWGLQQVSVKLALAGIPPLLQGGLRSAGALVLLGAWMAARGEPLLRHDGSLLPGLVAGLLFTAEFLLVYSGMVFTTASRGVLFLYTAPFFVALGAHVFLPGERMRLPQALGLLCAFTGVVIAFADALHLPTARELTGDCMLLAAALLWAATTLVIKGSRLTRISPDKVLFYQLAVSAALLPLGSAALGERAAGPITPVVTAAFAFQIVVVAFSSYLAWFWLISRYPAAKLSSFSFLTPLFGILAGGAILGEPVTAALVVAMLLVGAGIRLVNRRSG
jgi:drug/metabolite transporter (DMT)-like permease